MCVQFFRGWQLALSGSLLYSMTNGMLRIYGVLFPAIMLYEELDREAASWPLNIHGISTAIMAPVAGFISSRFSPVRITTIGTLIFCLGTIPCYFSTNKYVLSIFFGVVRGGGMAIVLTAVSSLLSTSFSKNRSTVMGILNAGSSIAGIILPLLTQYFLDIYDLKGTFLLLTGLSLNAFIGAVGLISYKRLQSLESIPTLAPKKNYAAVNHPCVTTSSNAIISENHDTLNSFAIEAVVNKNNKPESDSKKGLKVRDERTPPTITLVNMAFHNDTVNPEICSGGILTEIQLEGKSDQMKETKSINKQTLKIIFSTRSLYIIAFSVSSAMLLFTSVIQVIVDYLVDKGVQSSSAVFTLIILSCGEISGNLGLGWLTDGEYLSRRTQITTTLTLSSLMVVLFIFTNNYWLLMTYTFILGLCQGNILPVLFAQVSEYFTTLEVPLAMSFVLSITGLTTMIKVPVIGFFRDELGSYDYLFVILGGFNLLSALSWVVDRICTRKEVGNYELLKEIH